MSREEEIARIIDPEAFPEVDCNELQERQDVALAKAKEIVRRFLDTSVRPTWG